MAWGMTPVALVQDPAVLFDALSGLEPRDQVMPVLEALMSSMPPGHAAAPFLSAKFGNAASSEGEQVLICKASEAIHGCSIESSGTL